MATFTPSIVERVNRGVLSEEDKRDKDISEITQPDIKEESVPTAVMRVNERLTQIPQNIEELTKRVQESKQPIEPIDKSTFFDRVNKSSIVRKTKEALGESAQMTAAPIKARVQEALPEVVVEQAKQKITEAKEAVKQKKQETKETVDKATELLQKIPNIPENLRRGIAQNYRSMPGIAGNFAQTTGAMIDQPITVKDLLEPQTAPGALGVRQLVQKTGFGNWLEREGKRLSEKNQLYMQTRTDLQPTGDDVISRFSHALGSGMVSIAEAAAIGALTRSPALAGGVFGLQSMSDTFVNAKAQGLDDETAIRYAVIDGVVEGGLESLSLNRILKPGVGRSLRAVMTTALTEASTEGLQEAKGNIIRKYGLGMNQNIMDNVIMSMAVGGVLGGTTTLAIPESVKQRLDEQGVPEQAQQEILGLSQEVMDKLRAKKYSPQELKELEAGLKDGVITQQELKEEVEGIEPKEEVRATEEEKPQETRAPEPKVPEETRYQIKEAPAFYSKLEKTIDTMPASMPKQDFSNWLDKQGVKKEEREWMGLDEYMDGKDKLTKEDVLAFVRGNAVEIEESTLDDREATELSDKEREEYQELSYKESIGEPFTKEMATRLDILESRSIKANEQLLTKYGQYTVPGGENYREVLFRLPRPDVLPDGWTIKNDKEYGWMIKKADGEVIQGTSKEDVMANARKYFLADKSDYRTSHFDQPNILAHTRLNDRTDTDGNKVLFIEEIQSDWHQEGRKKGYKNKDALAKEKEVQNKVNEINKKADKIKKEAYVKDNEKLIKMSQLEFLLELEKNNPEYKSLVKERSILNNELVDIRKETRGVPDAPFKKTWHEFVLKKLLREASEKGYDKIAWTTGEMQAERYDLSKQVDYVESEKLIDKRTVYISLKNNSDITLYVDNNGIVTESSGELRGQASPTGKSLEDVIGKELAGKIMTQEESSQKYDKADLKVGLKGMADFYNKMIPQYLNKYLKKFGGKVEVSEIDVPEEKGRLRYEIMDRNGDIYDAFPTLELAEQAVRDLGQGYSIIGESKEIEKVLSVEITPEMRKAFLEVGQPLFQQGKAKPGRQILELAEARRILKSYNVDISQVQKVKEIITANGRKASGSYRDGVIKIAQSVQNTTGAHEAFHYFVDNFVDEKLYNNAVAEVKRKTNLKEAGEIEEYLAEKFGEYRATKRGSTGFIRQMFQKIMFYVKQTFGRDKAITKLFKDFESGKLREGNMDALFKNTKFQNLPENEKIKAMNLQKRINEMKQKNMTQKEIAKFVDQIDKILTRKPSKGTKQIIREVTGVKKEDPVVKTMTEKQALVGQIKRKDLLAKMKAKAETVQQFKKDVVDYANQILDKEIKGKLLARVKNVSTKGELKKALDYIDKIEAEFEKRKAISSLKKTISKLDVDKLRPEYKQKVLSLIDPISLQGMSKKTLSKLQSMRQYIEENLEHNIPDSILARLDRLEKKPVADMNIDDINALELSIKHLVALNKLKNKIFQKGKLIDYVEKRDKAVENIFKKKAIEEDPDNISILDNQKGLLARTAENIKNIFTTESYNAELNAEIMDKEDKGANYDILYDGFNEGRDNQLRMRHEAQDYFKENFKDININDWSTAFKKKKDIKKIKLDTLKFYDPETKRTRTVQLTPAMKIALYLHTLAPDNRANLLVKGFVMRGQESRTPFKLTESDLDTIESSLSREERIVADTIDKYYNEIQNKKINKVSVDLNGFEIATVEQYYPIVANALDRAQNALKLKDITPESIRSYTNATIEGMGMLKERTGAKSVVVLEDAFTTLTNSINMASSYYGLAKPLRSAKMLINDPVWERSVINTYNKDMSEYFKRYIRDIEGQSYQDSKIGKAIQHLMNRVTVGILGLNPGVMLKQPISFSLVGTEMNPKYVAIGAATLSKNIAKANKAKIALIEKYSPQLRERFTGNIDRDLGELAIESEARNFFTDQFNLERDVIMKGISNFDRGAILSIWDAVSAEIKDASPELKDDALYNKIARRTEEIVRRTQPTFDIKDRSGIGRNPDRVVRFFTKFSSQRNKNVMIMRRAVERFSRSSKTPDDILKLINSLGLVTIVANLMLMGVDWFTKAWRNGFDKKSVNKEKKLSDKAIDASFKLLELNIGNIYFVGPLFRAIKGKMQGGFGANEFYSVQDPLSRTIDDFATSSADLGKGLIELKNDERYKRTIKKYGIKKGDRKGTRKVKKALSRLIIQVGTLVGKPIGNISNYGYKPLKRWFIDGR